MLKNTFFSLGSSAQYSMSQEVIEEGKTSTMAWLPSFAGAVYWRCHGVTIEGANPSMPQGMSSTWGESVLKQKGRTAV